MSEDIEPQPKDIRGRTWLDAFYVQTKAFLEKNSEHVKEIERLKAAAHDDDTCPHLVRANLLEAENARLKAEVERLTAFTTRTIIPNEELQAQVERLTKAGDAMLSEWASGDEKDAQNFLKALVIWNAAKEGKQP